MIHETLFRFLISETGGEDMEWDNFFELQEFLHPGERNLLQRIMEIAAQYHIIESFNNKILHGTVKPSSSQATVESSEQQKVPNGLYIRAFCRGVHNVLSEYRQEVADLEKVFFENPQLSLTFILSSIEKYRSLFSVLKSIVGLMEGDNLKGCLLIEKLHKYLHRGTNDTTTAIASIICSINMVFYRHLCNWIIYGNLDQDDSNGEFFICDGDCLDEDFLYPEQFFDSNPETSSTNDSTNIFRRTTKIKHPPVVRKFYIKWPMVPMFINKDTAESILFMGRIVWILRNDPKTIVSGKFKLQAKRDVWSGKDIEYYKKIESLEQKPFNMVHFQMVMEECRLELTKYLWSVMLVEGNLIQNLNLIRDYYTLRRGELFQNFITSVEKYSKHTSKECDISNMNFIFMETVRKIYGENDKSYMRFELRNRSDINADNLWSNLQLNFEIQWPLHIIFHPKAMRLYNKLFNYLLQLKKTQINLNKLWFLKVDRHVWPLRQRLIFLVNNLQYYFQVDVIEAQFSILLKAVENTNEFEDIIKIHHEFVTNLLAKTFVLTPDESHTYESKHTLYQVPAVQFDVPSKVYNVIINLLNLCDEFCLVARTWESVLTEPCMKELESFQKRTDFVIESLMYLLYHLQQKAKGQHILQLLHQLDFTTYFSKNKPDFNLTFDAASI